VTPSLYIPLRGALFPELVDSDVAVPLSGFRAVRVGLSIRDLPGGYGAETHLNLEVPLGGGRVVDCDLGTYEGKLREYSNIPAIGIDVAKALLDAAEAHGRLQHDARPEWDAWVAAVVSAMTSQPRVGADDSAYVERLLSTAARPLPSTR
jgi:hypothetical protein